MLKMSLIPTQTMIPNQTTIQFLVIGIDAMRRPIEKRVNTKFTLPFTTAEMRVKKEQIRKQYLAKGSIVNVYTVSNNLKK